MNEREDRMTNAPKTHTDLPLLPGGNNGNTPGAAKVDPGTTVWDLLRDASAPLPQPPIGVLDARAVLAWVERAGAALVLRRDRQRLLRQVIRIVDDDWRTAMATERLRDQLDRQQERIEAKKAGTYWRHRDDQRVARQPTHVLVDRDAWDRVKIQAVTRSSSLGVLVGQLVTAEVRRPRARDWSPDASGHREREARLFARLSVSKETWGRFRVLSSGNQVTIERFIGALVEEAFPPHAPGR